MLKTARYLSYVYFILGTFVLGLYGIIVSPSVASLPYRTTFLIFSIAFTLVAILKWKFEEKLVDEAPILNRPHRQLIFDFVLYLLVGVVIFISYVAMHDLPSATGMRMFFATVTFGYFASIDNTLTRERAWFEENRTFSVDKLTIFPIFKKLSLFLTLTILLTVIITPLTVLKDINFISPEITSQYVIPANVFVLDITFFLGIILVLALRLIHSYSDNLKFILNTHIEVLSRVQLGDLNHHVPILTRDEFSQIAQQTNRMIDELREKDQLRKTLEKIVSPNILEKLLTTDDKTLKQGQEYNVAILFCDLREFTNFTETASAEDVIFFLNSYFSEIVRIVSDHNGLINKFMGDAILAVYGLEEGTNPVEDAVETSWAILNHARSIKTPDGTTMDIGVGIHSGKVIAGTIGSEDRYEYTFIGDAVNTASRLDGLSKRLGHKIIVSKKAYMDLNDETKEKFTDLNEHILRGKREAVHVYGAASSYNETSNS